MWSRAKMAWLVLTGKAYCIPYATIYQDYVLWQQDGAKSIKMSEVCDPTSWNPTRQKGE